MQLSAEPFNSTIKETTGLIVHRGRHESERSGHSHSLHLPPQQRAALVMLLQK